MKNILRALILGIMLTAFDAAVAVKPAFAQTPAATPTEADVAENVALYKKFTENRAGTVEQMKTAVEAGKQYIEKYNAIADYSAQVEYIKKDVPRLEGVIGKKVKGQKLTDISARYDASFKNSNYDESYAAGKEFLGENPELLDVMIDLGSIGYDESRKATPNNKYNADTINYAKQAIQKIEGGAKSEVYGFFYTYGTEPRVAGNDSNKFPGRDNTLGNLNFKIGYIMYFNQNMKKEAIPYFYKASKYDSSVKNTPLIYTAIADSYFEEAKRLNALSEKQATDAGNKDTEESIATDALAKGYADRAIDAYARAYKLASAPNAGVKPQYKDGLYKLLQELFKFRYEGKIDGLDSYVASVMSKEFVDPSTTVAPAVIAPKPAATASGAPSTSSLSTTSNTNVAATASTGASTVKSGASAAKPAAATPAAIAPTAAKPAAKAKTPAKKVAPKKKGTR